jgi:hypothetical protein
MAMTTATFDTHKLVIKLRNAGVEENQAEAITDAIKEAQQGAQLATKADVETAIAKAQTEIIKWTVGAVFIAVGLFATLSKVIH